MLTIQSDGPDWACSPLRNENSCVYKNNSDFQNYIETLLQRYPNQIQRIQYGNEWQSDFWYIGNGEQFTAANNIVYNAIQQFSPQTKLVLGGFTTISLRFLAGCGGQIDSFYNDEGNLIDQDFLDANCSSPEFQYVVEKINTILKNAQYDEIDIHLYDDAENWPVFFDVINTMVRKPIIVTEFGGPNVNIEPVDEQYQAERLERYIRQIDALSITDAYFFKLVEGTNNPAHIKSGLIRAADLSKKQSFFTFKTLNQ